VLLAIADADYKFVYIDVDSFGKDADSTIFERTEFFKKLENNELNIPTSQLLPETENLSLPYIFVGDEAFFHFLTHYAALQWKNIVRRKKNF